MAENVDVSVPVWAQDHLTQGFNTHQAGRYDGAVVAYMELLARPDVGSYPHAQAEAWRGAAAACGQIGTPAFLATGRQYAESAKDIHQELVDAGHDQLTRFWAADLLVLGRLSLQTLIDDELSYRHPTTFLEAAEYLRKAVELTSPRPKEQSFEDPEITQELQVVSEASDPAEPVVAASESEELTQEEFDQHYINALWLSSLRKVLCANMQDGRYTARKAIAVGWQSERKGAPTSSTLLDGFGRMKARARAIIRPYGVLAVAALIGNKSNRYMSERRYRAALHLSEALIVGPRRARQLSKLRNADPNVVEPAS